ncbi:MAG: ECF-type sigma factor [Candidatus Eisenbacteria bacterium]
MPDPSSFSKSCPQTEMLCALIPSLYGELRSMAKNYLRRERFHHTLQPTDLVHEATCVSNHLPRPWGWSGACDAHYCTNDASCAHRLRAQATDRTEGGG